MVGHDYKTPERRWTATINIQEINVMASNLLSVFREAYRSVRYFFSLIPDRLGELSTQEVNKLVKNMLRVHSC